VPSETKNTVWLGRRAGGVAFTRPS